MHPIERLRYVARASGAPQAALVQETAAALASFSADPQGLVTACRRIVSRQPTSAPLVWFAARVLTSGDPRSEIWQAAGEVQADPTVTQLVRHLPDEAAVVVLGWPDQVGDALPRRGDLEVRVVDALGEGGGLARLLWQSDVDSVDVPQTGLGAAAASADLVLLEATAAGPEAFLAVSGSRAAAAVAHHAGVPVWLVAGVGRMLPGPMWTGLQRRLPPDDAWEAELELVPFDLVDAVVGPTGPAPVAEALQSVACPVAPELFRGDVF